MPFETRVRSVLADRGVDAVAALFRRQGGRESGPLVVVATDPPPPSIGRPRQELEMEFADSLSTPHKPPYESPIVTHEARIWKRKI